jgi:DNA-binding transcriptional MerR regulator
MSKKMTIGEVARQTGMSAKTLRFYETEGILTPPGRDESGYRTYTAEDLRRVRLARRARLLGLSLPVVKTLVEQAFHSDCIEFGDQYLSRITDQRIEIDQRIAELQALKGELDELEQHVRHCQIDAHPGQKVADCAFCPMIDEEGR